MRLFALLSVISALALAGEEAKQAPPEEAKKAADAKPADAKPADAKPADAKPADAKPADAKPADAKPADAKEAAAPAPEQESPLRGTIDFGYRWHGDVRGNAAAYRSIVDLGEGPKLFGLDLSFESASKKFFDRIDLRASNWGGDPYNTARLDVRKQSVYNLTVDYRNLAYYNFLPSFADPALAQGRMRTERAYDLNRRMSNVELDIFPGTRFIPYLAWVHDSGSGSGITTFVADGNEYPVATLLRDKTDNFRGGLRIELRNWHWTLEQGGTIFKEDDRVFTSDANPGNRTTPLGTELLRLNTLAQAYGIRGNTIYSRALMTGSPFAWLNVSGQFLYSRPSTNTNYSMSDTGRFVVLSSLLFYNGQQDLAIAEAKQPHTSGNVGIEVRPLRRVRIVESLLTDRLHNSSGASLTERLLLSGTSSQTGTSAFADRLVWNYNQQQFDIFYDATNAITLRGGYRYVWGDAEVRAPILQGPALREGTELKRHVGLAGIYFRPSSKLRVNVDAEVANGISTYFRTSLQDYTKVRAQVRYQAMASLLVTANVNALDNQNPAPGISYDFRSTDASLAVQWQPPCLKRASILAEYTRSTLHSDILYFNPGDFSRARSFYRDNAHVATGLLDLTLPHAKLSLGGSMYLSGGSRPTDYYQPLVRVIAPVYKHVSFKAEWRWYSLAEPLYFYEGFGSHIFQIGLQITR